MRCFTAPCTALQALTPTPAALHPVSPSALEHRGNALLIRPASWPALARTSVPGEPGRMELQGDLRGASVWGLPCPASLATTFVALGHGVTH